MKYSVDIYINNDLYLLSDWIKRISDSINDWDKDNWGVSIDLVDGLENYVYLNFNINYREIKISKHPIYNESLELDGILNKINELKRNKARNPISFS